MGKNWRLLLPRALEQGNVTHSSRDVGENCSGTEARVLTFSYKRFNLYSSHHRKILPFSENISA